MAKPVPQVDEEKTVAHLDEDKPKSSHASTTHGGLDAEVAAASKKLRNPLAGISKEELFRDVEEFAVQKDLVDIVELLKKGALAAQSPKNFENITELSEEDKNFLRLEQTKRWKQPWMMYFMTSVYYCFYFHFFLAILLVD